MIGIVRRAPGKPEPTLSIHRSAPRVAYDNGFVRFHMDNYVVTISPATLREGLRVMEQAEAAANPPAKDG